MAEDLETMTVVNNEEAKAKLVRLVRAMCLDNDMGTEPVEKWRFAWRWNLRVLLEEVWRIPDNELDTFAAGEESEVKALVVKYDCRHLHEWLNAVFDDGESMGIVTPAYPIGGNIADAATINRLDMEDDLRLAKHAAHDAFYRGLLVGMLLASAAIFGTWALLAILL